MSTFTETILARYEATETEIDAFGREISLRRLRPAEAQLVRKLADTDRTGVLGDAMIAACVRSIDEKKFACPRVQSDLDVVLNALDIEGMQAAAQAWVRLMGFGKDAEGASEKAAEEAKN